MTRSEQETIFCYAADEDHISVFTAHPPTARKIERAGYVAYKVTTRGDQPNGWFYKICREEFRWRIAAKKKRTISPEQSQAGAARLAAARVARSSTANSNGPSTESGGAL